MSVKKKQVYIEGIGLEISFRDATRSLSELIFSTVQRAIADGGKDPDTIDSVVLAAHDLVDGRSLSSMVTAPAAGAYLRDEIRFGDDGAAAFAAAMTRIEAGESKRSIVAAWGRASEHDPTAVARTLFDPFFAGPFGLDESAVCALRAQAWMRDGGDTSAYAAARKRRDAAVAANPRALKSGGKPISAHYPLKDGDLPPFADIVAAAVISAEPSGLKVTGLGQSSEPYWIGDRKIGALTGLGNAARAALNEAGLATDQLDLIEADGLSLYDEAMALEAIGLAPQGGGLACLAKDLRCNPSGGGAGGYCAPAMGLARLIEAALRLRTDKGLRRALATGSSIVAAQTHTAIVLEAA